MFFDKRKKAYISKMLVKHGLNISVCIGIYNIETSYRYWLFRMCENLWFIKDFVLNKLLKKPIKNLTIGVYQIGLTSILKYNGYDVWQYYDLIPEMTFKQFWCIIKAMLFKNNVDIFCEKVREYTLDCDDINSLIARYGELYNGNTNYILMLHKEHERIEQLQNT